MEIATLVRLLDQPHQAGDDLHAWGLADLDRARQGLLDLADSGLTLDLLAGLCRQLGEHLPRTGDPDAALAALVRFLFASRSPLALAALLERDRAALPMLLAALVLGPRWADVLVDDPEAFDLLHQTGGQPIDRERLLEEVTSEVAALEGERAIAAALGRLRRRHLLRIAYGEVALRHRYELVVQQLSLLAEALVEAALRAAQQSALQSRPWPRRVQPPAPQCAVLALGRLGGGEMDYASALELLLVYDAAAEDAATFRAVAEHYERLARVLARLLGEADGEGPALGVQWLHLPDSNVAAIAHAMHDVAVGLENFGRTWHRQAMLSARPIAGDRSLGQALVERLAPWQFRRYLSRADETGIKALKRRIVQRATLHQDDWRSPEIARGGLADIESTVQFLQLLVGGEQPAVRRPGTLDAIAALELAGTLTVEERSILEESYTFQRRLAHRLQILTPGDSAELPDDDRHVERLAESLDAPQPAASSRETLQSRQLQTWRTLKKLLDSAFAEEPPMPREVELLLDPAPPPEEIRAALAPFGFAQPEAALAALDDLAAEQVPFLSTRRCRHFLAGILPQLLGAIAEAPHPDRTLDNLVRVSNSLGGKGALWELFHFHPPSLLLYVRLCAASPYLSDILTTNPGMIDELVDSLQLDRLPARQELDRTLAELSRGADDPLAALYDLKNAQHLRIGVRDMLGKDDIDRTHQALADVAETCLANVTQLECDRLVEKHGVPTCGPGPAEGQPCGLAIVGLGKLGGREPNYHSELEVLFVYEGEGLTQPRARSRRGERTANSHFFTQLAQRVFKQLAQLTPKGRLYAIDSPLRPIGIGALALSLADLRQHFSSGAAPLWHWQALCQARPVFGEPSVQRETAGLIRELLISRPWSDDDRTEIRRTRLQLEKGASERNLKRSAGGTLDVEFLVQMLQLMHAGRRPEVLASGTQQALSALAAVGVLPADAAEQLGDAYRFLRRVESGLRLLNTTARHDLPADEPELRQLALLLGHSNPARLRDTCLAHLAGNRAIFDRFIE